MKSPNEIVLFDLKTGPMSIKLYGSDAPVIIDPFEAINWIANGEFSDVFGPRPWTELVGDTIDGLISRTGGRYELAEEIVMAAIHAGRIRCVYISEDNDGHPRLTYIDPLEFEGKELHHEWEDGLTVQICVDVDDEDPIQFDKFWFFWDEIVSFAPRRPESGIRHVALPSTLTAPTNEVLRPQFGDNSASVTMGTPSLSEQRRGRGRPAGKNGEPIAMFVLRVQAEGIDKLKDVSDEALGAMLKEEYFRLGLKVPETTNAARDARGVLRALVKMEVKIDDEAAE